MTSSTRIRVARVLPALDFGGVESRVAMQAENHDRERFDLHVVAFHREGEASRRIRAAGVPVHILDVAPSVRDLRATAKLTGWLREMRPDIIHATAAEAMFAAALAGNVARVPRIVTEQPGIPGVQGRRPMGRMVFAGLHRMVDGVVVVSRSVGEHLKRAEHLPASRTFLIHNVAQPAFFTPVTRSFRDVGSSRFRFLTASRLVAQKNLDLLIRALADGVRGGSLDAELSIAGAGPLRAELESLTTSLGVGDRVKFLGYRSDVRALLDEHDAFVFAAAFGEGLSVALLEAMARATPLIASDGPGNAEAAGGLGDGWVLPANDRAAWTTGLARLAGMSSQARERHGLLGRSIAETSFSPARYRASVERMYRDVLRAPSSRLVPRRTSPSTRLS